MFFFFKQKTAYEMRISDWSSDVCSSDLYVTLFRGASRCELESAGRCLFGNLPYPFDPPGDDRQDFRQCGQSAFPPARCTLLGTTPPVFHFRQSGLRSARRCDGRKDRSEEHTSELQSLMRISYAVFCLKKKITT